MGRCYTSPVICMSSRLNSKGQAFAPFCGWYGRVDKMTFAPGRTVSACLFHSFLSEDDVGDLMNIIHRLCVFRLYILDYSFTLSPWPLSCSLSLPHSPSLSFSFSFSFSISGLEMFNPTGKADRAVFSHFGLSDGDAGYCIGTCQC